MKGIPHTIKVERKGNELIVHIALTERKSWDHTGVILASEGWQDIGYGLKMQLTIASTNIVLQKERIKLIQKPGILNRLRGKTAYRKIRCLGKAQDPRVELESLALVVNKYGR